MLSFDVANVVEPVVCNSSPEGYLPSETDDGNAFFFSLAYHQFKE